MAFSLKLNSSSGVPYYKQIVDYIIYSVINGILKPGEKLPTVRQLAVDLQVNLNTIVKAYSELEHKSIVHTQQGTGTFIAETQPDIDNSEKKNKLHDLCSLFLDEISSFGISAREALGMLEKIIHEKRADKKRGGSHA
ncbi:MAG TPA: GntR family transcriptional regulator [Spirochaetia bacterium]|nr:GntR family transcriptional regulator [Spirochaetia bacterium]